ncbi:tight adherence pilus pseudopilin TadF [Aliivibrio fischeri]|uniref:tight adherence pilus pseudopilin TadF n=1 Tax=Aliivibrio fischeri TaxID=668 RepID=UPI0012D86147|nr:tight adherence pilus pseudopilin TadF [Aliivibrio fischeri]MUI55809.1 ATP-binding protein [Aliivibrio fischeri]
MPLKFKQRGNFTVEFAMVGLGLSLIFIFSADVIIKLSIKGKLDRLSYSLVNVLKERTQLYDEDYLITNSESNEIFNIAKNSLSRTLGSYEDERFGAVIEELTFRDIGAPNTPVTYNYGSFSCPLSKRIGELDYLSVVTTWERQATLYRVTLCYQTDNMFGSVVGESYTDVISSSVMIGR